MRPFLQIMKSLADGNRLRVVTALMENEELCVCEITEMLQIAMATVSRHMSILTNAGIVESRKDGRWVYFKLSGSFPKLLRQWLRESLKGAQEIERDRKNLKNIIATVQEKLCKDRK